MVWWCAGRARAHVRLGARVRHRTADSGAEPHAASQQRILRGRTALGRRTQPHQLHQLGEFPRPLVAGERIYLYTSLTIRPLQIQMTELICKLPRTDLLRLWG